MQKQGDAYGFLQYEEISCDGIQIVFFAAITDPSRDVLVFGV